MLPCCRVISAAQARSSSSQQTQRRCTGCDRKLESSSWPGELLGGTVQWLSLQLKIFSQKLRRSFCQDTALQQLWASRELNLIRWAPEWLSKCLIDGSSTAVWSSVLFTSCDNQEQLLKKQLVTYTDQIAVDKWSLGLNIWHLEICRHLSLSQ